MKLVANYEIRSECSVVADDRVLRIRHPKGTYRARIKNIPRSVYTQPFLLSLHLYFDAPSLEEAQDVADGLLNDCLNMLAFVIGGAFRRHRIRQIVEAHSENAMRSLLMWGDAIEYEDPHPILEEEYIASAERLLEFEMPAAIRRAMRWYRLGINAILPDDQFMYFWFALEIVAEFQKAPDKVPSKCPQCQSPLFCETCEKHPIHRPYAKQAISALLKSVDPKCDDTIIAGLDRARNGLMHGSTLKELESGLPEPREQIVDVLGGLLWKALLHQFPPKTFDGKLSVGHPSTYIHRSYSAIGHISTIVPVGPDGDLDLDFSGMTMAVKPHGPPQSAHPTIICMSAAQHKHLAEIGAMKGDHQDMCRRIYQRVRVEDGKVLALVLSTDMKTIRDALNTSAQGAWQSLFREILEGADRTENSSPS